MHTRSHAGKFVRICTTLAAACALLVATSISGDAASSSTVITANVPSATSLTNTCTAPSARAFGVVQPGSSATTATGAGVCRFDFSSSNDTSMLRIGQDDGAGVAMGQASGTWPTKHNGSQEWFSTTRGSSAGTIFAGEYSLWRSTDSGATWTNRGSTGTFAHRLTAKDDNVLWAARVYTDELRKSTDAGATWANGNTGLGIASIRAIAAAPGTDTIWVGASDGTIKQQTVSGGAWTAQTSNLTEVMAMDAVSTTSAWAIGVNGCCSTDKVRRWDGASWVSLPNLPVAIQPGGQHLWQIDAVSSTCAYAVNGDTVMRWNQAGSNWVSTFLPDFRGAVPDDVTSISGTGCTGTDDVWVSGGYGSVWHSTNGAASFTRVPTPAVDYVSTIQVLNGTTAVAIGSGELGMMTADDGSSWTVGHEAANIRSVDAWSGSNAVAVGGTGKVAVTSNGGTSWSWPSSGTSNGLFDVAVAGSNVGIAVGESGTIRRSSTNGTTWSGISSGTSNRLYSIDMGTATSGWAVGEGGTILRTTDAGATWVSQANGIATTIQDIDAVDDQIAWAVSRSGRWMRTTNGGALWTDGPITGILAWEGGLSVAATGATNAWIGASGGSSPLFRTTDSGTSWTKPGMGAGDLQVLADGTLFVTGNDEVRVSSDGGVTSTAQPAPDADWPTLRSISMLDSMVGFAAGGSIVKTTPTGTVPDWVSPTNDWDPDATGMFGLCVQDVALSATVQAPFVEDTLMTPGSCQAVTADPWAALPGPATTVASTGSAGQSGRVDIVWGFRAGVNQSPGVYSTVVAVEVLAPAA